MQKKQGFWSSILMGVGFTVIFSLVSVIIFSFMIKGFNISANVTKTVNQFIKSTTIFIGCFFFLSANGGLLKGGLLGGLSSIILVLLFSLIAGGFLGLKSMLLDFLFCFLIGTISGIITVNLKK